MTPNPGQPAVPAIHMRHVDVGAMRDPRLVVAEDVNWTVSAGDFWVVAGLQGAGKTDFLSLTAGLMPPLGGTYTLFGEPMPIFQEERLAKRLRLGMVFDGGQLFNHLTVSENIALPLRYHQNLDQAAAGETVQRFLDAMELGPWADSTPGAIGRNWATRAGLARALILQPEVLLIDNPLGGLDLRHFRWWIQMLGELSRGHSLTNGKPLILVATTADLRPWKGSARQFAVLRNRQFVVLGDWVQLEAASRELLHELMTAEIEPAKP